MLTLQGMELQLLDGVMIIPISCQAVTGRRELPLHLVCLLSHS